MDYPPGGRTPAEVAPGLLVGGGYPTTLLELRALKKLGVHPNPTTPQPSSSFAR